MAELYNDFALSFAEIALKAAAPIVDIYQQDFTVRSKSDGSPVTDADLAADIIIREKLTLKWPDIPIISEESYASSRHRFDQFFLVDPLDGTKEFLNRTGEFTVNIALICKGQSVAGAVYAPLKASMYIGGERAFEMTKIDVRSKIETSNFCPIRTRKVKIDELTALASVSHSDVDTEKFLQHLQPKVINRSGSSFKFCVLAKGDADIYPRFSPTMGWDIAAGHAVLKAAGGTLINQLGHEFHYDSSEIKNGAFLAVGDRELAANLKQKFLNVVRDQSHAKNDIAEPKLS